LKLDIPVPRINLVRNYDQDVPAVYKLPVSFIRYHRRTPGEWKSTLEYISDAEDEIWLKQKQFFKSTEVQDETIALPAGCRLSANAPHLSMELFEHMMDILDKETAFDSIITISQAEAHFQARIPQLYQLFPTKLRQGSVNVKHVIQEIYTYWVQKRSKLKRPLLRRFWPVTSTDDTNPHMVFRPREKEKYKLRKKRQNDLNACRKLKQLREDFDNLRTVLDIVRHREELHRIHVQLQVDLYQQRLYDAIDTSGTPRPSTHLSKDDVLKVLNETPLHFDVNLGGRKAKRARLPMSLPPSSSSFPSDAVDKGKFPGNVATLHLNIAGRNNGDPAPNFLQSLPTRESYVTSWEGVVPHLPTYENAQLQSTYKFRHRPRVGRGGRLCIDRVPQCIPQNTNFLTDNTYCAGNGMHFSLNPKHNLLELLPKPLNHAAISRRIEALSVAAIKEDFEARNLSAVTAGDVEDNEADEAIVDLDEWLETDEQQWGDERYVIGPI
jgi:enhancer of polycomb-like protein